MAASTRRSGPAARPARATTPPTKARPRVAVSVLLGGLALAYSPAFLPGLARSAGILDLPWGPANVLVWNWLAVAALLAYVAWVERLPLASLRLTRPTEKDIEWGCYLGAAGALWHWATASALSRWAGGAVDTVAPGGMTEGAQQLVALGPLVLAALVVTAAVTEEVLWRGYAVERLAAWLPPLAVTALGLAVFAAPHVAYFGPTWLVTNLPGAAVLYALLLWRRNLWACIAAHLVGNAPILVVALTS